MATAMAIRATGVEADMRLPVALVKQVIGGLADGTVA